MISRIVVIVSVSCDGVRDAADVVVVVVGFADIGDRYY